MSDIKNQMKVIIYKFSKNEDLLDRETAMKEYNYEDIEGILKWLKITINPNKIETIKQNNEYIELNTYNLIIDPEYHNNKTYHKHLHNLLIYIITEKKVNDGIDRAFRYFQEINEAVEDKQSYENNIKKLINNKIQFKYNLDTKNNVINIIETDIKDIDKFSNLTDYTNNMNLVTPADEEVPELSISGGKGFRKRTTKTKKSTKKSVNLKKITKKTRKHKGIIQSGGNKGKLKKGYRYSGLKTKTGLSIIVKSK